MPSCYNLTIHERREMDKRNLGVLSKGFFRLKSSV